MIRYDKSVAVPSSLRRGIAANTANCAAYDAVPAPYRRGDASFIITGGIYGTKVVKRHLKADQHDKCGFCEAIFDANVAGDVEHYRPKGAVMTATGRLPGPSAQSGTGDEVATSEARWPPAEYPSNTTRVASSPSVSA